MLTITLPRGDRTTKKIAITDSTGTITDIVFDDIFFTVKRAYTNSDFKFQKRLSDGDITLDSDGYYNFTIEPEDTDDLAFGEYDFDIELYKEGAIKATTIGKLYLTREVTYASNEE